VSRIEATSSALSMSLTLDVNMDLYPLGPGDRITVLLASTLHGADESAKKTGQDGAELTEDDVEDRREAWRGGDEGLAADYDYVTYGKVSKPDQRAGISVGNRTYRADLVRSLVL
jgi:DNA-directed RNA polymerase I, II, and III subunit RPABC3